MKKSLMLLILAMAILTGCSKGEETVKIVAAASLTEVFTEMKDSFETKYPDQKVEFIFGGSQECVSQIKEGGDFDVFASANMKYMEELIEEGYVADGQDEVFATNKLQVIVHKDVEGITSLEDLVKEEVSIVLADESVPVGRYTLSVLENMIQSGMYDVTYKEQFLDNVVSYETNVKSVATKVAMGEADAGIVYRTDITKSVSENVHVIDIPEEYNVVAKYPIAVLEDSKRDKEADKWVEYVLSEEGRIILEQYGFDS